MGNYVLIEVKCFWPGCREDVTTRVFDGVNFGPGATLGGDSMYTCNTHVQNAEKHCQYPHTEVPFGLCSSSAEPQGKPCTHCAYQGYVVHKDRGRVECSYCKGTGRLSDQHTSPATTPKEDDR